MHYIMWHDFPLVKLLRRDDKFILNFFFSLINHFLRPFPFTLFYPSFPLPLSSLTVSFALSLHPLHPFLRFLFSFFFHFHLSFIFFHFFHFPFILSRLFRYCHLFLLFLLFCIFFTHFFGYLFPFLSLSVLPSFLNDTVFLFPFFHSFLFPLSSIFPFSLFLFSSLSLSFVLPLFHTSLSLKLNAFHNEKNYKFIF